MWSAVAEVEHRLALTAALSRSVTVLAAVGVCLLPAVGPDLVRLSELERHLRDGVIEAAVAEAAVAEAAAAGRLKPRQRALRILILCCG